MFLFTTQVTFAKQRAAIAYLSGSTEDKMLLDACVGGLWKIRNE